MSAGGPQLLLLVTGAMVAGVVQGLSGFAFGMIAMSIWAWGIDPQQAAVMAVFGGLCGQILSALTIRRRWVAAEMLPFLLGGLVGVPIGVWILPQIDAGGFRVTLGLILGIGCPLMLVTSRKDSVAASGRTGDGLAGVAGGIIGGISGMTGIAPAIWSAFRGYDKERQRALLQNFNLVTLAAAMVAYLYRGMVPGAMIPNLGIVAASMMIPAMLGARIYRRLSESAFRRVVLILLTLAGFALLSSAVGG